MLQEKGNEIANALSSALFNFNHTLLVENKKNDEEELKTALKYFVAEWFFDWVDHYAKIHPTGNNSSSYSDYLSVFQKLKRKSCSLFTISETKNRKLLFVHEKPGIILSLYRRGKVGVVQMLEGNHWGAIACSRVSELHLSAHQLYKVFSKIEIIFEKRRKILADSDFKLTLPISLQSQLIRARLGKIRRNSAFFNIQSVYVIDYRLQMDDNHEFGVASITDCFDFDHKGIKKFHKIIRKAYSAIKSVTDMLPAQIDFTCSYNTEFSATFIEETKLSDDHLRLSMVMERMKEEIDKGNKNICDENYAVLLKAAELEGRLTIEAFKKQYEEGWSKRGQRVKEAMSYMGDYCGQIIVEPKWDSIIIYLLPKRIWGGRECRLCIPYSSDLYFLTNILFFLDKAAQLKELFDQNDDRQMAVGLLSKKEY